MTITLYKCKCDPMYLDKTSYLVDSITLSDAEFRSDIEIDLEYPYLILGIFSNYLLYNFCYINDLGKYYFIYDRKILDGNRLLLTLHEDQIFTFKAKILDANTKAFVKRSSTGRPLPNYDIFDDRATASEGSSVSYHKESTASPSNMINRCFDWASANDIYVMVCYMYYDPNTYITEPPSGYSPIIENNRYKNCGLDISTKYKLMDWDNFKVFARNVYQDPTLLSYIKSCYVFPFKCTITSTAPLTFDGTFPLTLKSTTLNIGSTTITVDNYDPRYFIHKFPIYNYKATLNIPSGWQSMNPHSKYSIWIDYYGWFEIEYKYIYNNELIIYYDLDWETGNTTLVCEAKENLISEKIVVRTEVCNVCAPISLSNTDAERVKNQRNANFQATTISTITGALSLAGGVVSKNPFLIASGVSGIGGGVVSGINKANQLYESGNTHPSSYSASVSMPYLTAYVLFKKESINYILPSEIGKPKMQYEALTNLKGYTEAVDLRIYDTTGITKHELEEIKKMVASGIII